jgi:hypothetical protein
MSPAHGSALILCRRAVPAMHRNSTAALALQSLAGRRPPAHGINRRDGYSPPEGPPSWDVPFGFAGMISGGAGGAAWSCRGGIAPARTKSRLFANGAGTVAENNSARRTGTPDRPLGRLLREARFPQQAAKAVASSVLGGLFHMPRRRGDHIHAPPGVSMRGGRRPLPWLPMPAALS